MENKNYTGLIPDNTSGAIIESAATQECGDVSKAKALYEIAKKRLLNVNQWHQLAGIISAEFQLVDENKQEVSREVREGDYFKIDIPGPGSKAGDGYDWVRVEDLKEVSRQDVDSIGLRVRPSTNPLSKDESIAHFYSEESTSTFIVTREGTTVLATIYDRNTKPNTDSETITDKIRHIAAGLGAISGFSRLQWQSLANALVKLAKS